jgi:hypothetical protein
MLEVGGRLPDLTLCGPGEASVALSSLHADGPLALIFLRHFG